MVPRFLSSAIEKGWQVTSLDNLIMSKVIIGHLDGNHGNLYPRNSEFVDSGIKYISANALIDGRADLSKSKFLTAERGAQFKKGVAKNGDVLFAHNATVGPVALLNTTDEYVILSTSLTYYRCDLTKVDNHYLVQYMSSPAFIRQYEKIMKQTTRNQIPITAQRDFYFVLPPLLEQRKIAKTLSTWDKAISTTERLINNSKQQKKALMQQLLTGKKRLLDDSDKPFDEEWITNTLGDLSQVSSSKRVMKSDYVEQGIPFYRSKEIILKSSGKALNDIIFISQQKYEDLESKFGSPVKGDILITAVGTLGVPYLVKQNEKFYFKDGNLLWLRNITDRVDTGYLLFYLKSELFQNSIDAVTGGSSQKALTIIKLSELEVKLPSIVEQRKIEAVLTNADKEIELLEQQLADLKQEKKALMQQLLTGKRRVKV